MERHGAALPLVIHLDLEPEDIAELAFERLEVRIDGLSGVARARTADIGAGPGAVFLAPGTLLRLANGKTLGDDFASEFFGVLTCRDGTRVPHTDIAFQ